jgi:hypothetical protein
MGSSMDQRQRQQYAPPPQYYQQPPPGYYQQRPQPYYRY